MATFFRDMGTNTDNTSASAAPLSKRLRDARRDMGLTQAELAKRAGCLQSQVSMLEGGMPNKVARETLEKIADLLGVELPKPAAEEIAAPLAAERPFAGHAYCPQADCPSNKPYVVGGELFFMPSPQPGAPRPGHRCAWCGEVLAFLCPKCGAVATAGACCRECGSPYIFAPPALEIAPEIWAARRRAEIAEIFGR